MLYCIAALQQNGYLQLNNPRAGVIGVGHVGSKVVYALQNLGYTVLQNDPLRAQRENNFAHTPLVQFKDLDLICLHTPLTTNVPYPTYHLLEQTFLQRQKHNCILLNAGRGAVIDSQELLSNGKHLHWCFDVWENEPNINLDVLRYTTIATPHIAGHSAQAKQHATIMLAQAMQNLLQLSQHARLQLSNFRYPLEQKILHSAPFNPCQITDNMKKNLLGKHHNSTNIFLHFRAGQKVRVAGMCAL